MHKSSLNNSKYLSIKTVMRYRYTIMDLIKTTLTDGLKAFTKYCCDGSYRIYLYVYFVYIIIYILFQKYRITIIIIIML